MTSASGVRSHTTQAHPAYEPANNNITRPWQLLIAGLLLVGVLSISVRSVCLPEVPGANERGLGVRHERRGAAWYHCQPWIRRVLSN